MIQSNIRKSKNNSLPPSNYTDPEIINLDDDENEIIPKTKTNPLVNFVKKSSDDSSLLTQNAKPVSSNEITTNQIVQESSTIDLDMTDAIERREKDNNIELVQFYKHLIPSMQKQINQLQYFEMSNGAVYTVTILPNYASPVGYENPCNIVFLKNSSDSNIQPVSRDLLASMLVNDIFDAINTTNNLGPSNKHEKLMIVSDEIKNPTFLKVIRSSPAVNIFIGDKPIKVTKLADNIVPVGEGIKLSKPADNIMPVGARIKLAKPVNNVMPVGERIKLAKPAINLMPVSERIKLIKLTTTTRDIKIKSPSSAVNRPIKKIQLKSTVTNPYDKFFKIAPSTKKGKYDVVSTNNRSNPFKYKCYVCARGFDRLYKFRRHQFVHHNSDKVYGNHILVDGVSNIVSEPTVEKMKETVVRKCIPTPEQLFTSNVESKVISKEEKLNTTVPNETAIPDDNSLLIPFYEIPMQEQSYQDYLNDFLTVKVKQEPEEHFEEV